MEGANEDQYPPNGSHAQKLLAPKNLLTLVDIGGVSLGFISAKSSKIDLIYP